MSLLSRQEECLTLRSFALALTLSVAARSAIWDCPTPSDTYRTTRMFCQSRL